MADYFWSKTRLAIIVALSAALLACSTGSTYDAGSPSDAGTDITSPPTPVSAPTSSAAPAPTMFGASNYAYPVGPAQINGQPAGTYPNLTFDAGVFGALAGDTNGPFGANRVYGITGDGGNTYYVTPSIHLWAADAGAPTITQAASTTGNGQTLYIISQAELDGGPDAGLYYSPGGIVLETPAPIGDGGGGVLGAYGTVGIQSGATLYGQFQLQTGGQAGALWLGTTGFVANNFAIESVGSSTFLNATTQDVISLGGALQIGVTAATITVVPTTITWNSAVSGGGPTLTQSTQTADQVIQPLTVQSQNAYPDAGVNTGGAPLDLIAGQGAILNGGNWSSGPVNLVLQTPGGTGAEKYVNVIRGGLGGTTLWQEGALVGTPTSSAIYGQGTPTATNFIVNETSGGIVTINTNGASLAFDVAGAQEGAVSGAAWNFGQPLSGNNVALSWFTTSVALTSGASNVLTSTQYKGPHIKFTGALTGAGTTVTFPATDGACWVLDFSAVTTIADSIALIANSNTWSVAVAGVGTEFPYICYSAGVGRLVGVSMIQ